MTIELINSIKLIKEYKNIPKLSNYTIPSNLIDNSYCMYDITL